MDDIAQLDDPAFQKLLQRVFEEDARRRKAKPWTVMLFVETETLVLKDLDPSVTLGALKGKIEEEVFSVEGRNLPGPSSKWNYLHNGNPVDDSKCISDYGEPDEENTSLFSVLPPKKRKVENSSEEKNKF